MPPSLLKIVHQNILAGLIWILLSVSASAQFKLYEDTFNGGVVTGGYSNGATVPSGSGNFNVSIPAGSTIHRAYLIAGHLGNAPDVTILLNGAPFTFSAANIITTGFNSIYGGNSAVHAINITGSISAATSAYTISVPVQNTVSDKYPEFYLYIAFANAGMPPVTSAIFLNTLTFSNSMPWTLTTTTPVSTTYPVGFGILGGYAAAGSDCENVSVNGTAIGNFSGTDFNASSQWGAMSGFQYYNNTLTGYNDDNANQAMSGPDALSNIAAIIPNNTTSVPVLYTHCGGGSDNHVWATFLTWGGGVVLDAQFVMFDAKAGESGTAELSWQVDGNHEISHYTIERSADQQTFLALEMVEASTENFQTYEFSDVSVPQSGAWYRIRYDGYNGAVRYSETKRVIPAPVPGLVRNSFPNPLSSGEDFYIELNCSDGGSFAVYQLSSGKEILSGNFSPELNPGNSCLIPTENFSPGVYLVKVSACQETEFLRLMVK